MQIKWEEKSEKCKIMEKVVFRGHRPRSARPPRNYVRTNERTPTKWYKKLIYTSIICFFYQFIWYFHFFVVTLRRKLRECAHEVRET